MHYLLNTIYRIYRGNTSAPALSTCTKYLVPILHSSVLSKTPCGGRASRPETQTSAHFFSSSLLFFWLLFSRLFSWFHSLSFLFSLCTYSLFRFLLFARRDKYGVAGFVGPYSGLLGSGSAHNMDWGKARPEPAASSGQNHKTGNKEGATARYLCAGTLCRKYATSVSNMPHTQAP